MDTLARKLEKCSRVKENIGFFSKKTNSIQYCESRLERNAALLREFNPNILTYVTQPTSFFYRRNCKTVRYTPDALIKTVNDDFYFEEVKPFERMLTSNFREKFGFLTTHVKEVIGYPLILNSALSQNDCATIANYQQLYFFLFTDLNVVDAKNLIGEIPIHTCIREIAEKTQQLKLPKCLGWQLVANGYYSYSNQNLLNANSPLELKNYV